MKNPFQIITKFIISLAIIGAAGLMFNTPASAAEMTISPAKATPELKRGQKHQGEFELYNTGKDSFKVKIYAHQYEATNDGYKLNGSSDRSLLHKWIKIDTPELEIEADKSATIKYTIDTPKDIPDGGQYAVIFAETINDEDINQSGVKATSRLGMLIYASTDGQNRLQGELKDVKIPFLNMGTKSIFSFNAKNTGNTHYDTHAELKITDLFGNQKHHEIKPNLTVLPDIDRKFEFEWNRSPVFAIMKVNLKASALDKNIDETKTVLFVSPIFFIILAAIIIILGATYVANKKTRYQYKK